MSVSWAILAPIKDEPKLKEWILYYSTFLKPTLFVIIDDHSLVSPQQDFQELGISNYVVVKHPMPSWVNQERTWNIRESGYTLYVKDIFEKHNIDYVLMVDADEFLYLNKFSNITDMVKHYEPFDLLKIQWCLFFNDGTLKEDTDIISYIDSYELSMDTLNLYSKTFTKVKSIVSGQHHMGAHDWNLIPGSVYKDLRNIPLSPGERYTSPGKIFLKDATMWVNHYFQTSISGVVKKHFANRDGCYEHLWRSVVSNKIISLDQIIPFHRKEMKNVVNYIAAHRRIVFGCNENEIQIHRKTIEAIEASIPFIKHFKNVYIAYFNCECYVPVDEVCLPVRNTFLKEKVQEDPTFKAKCLQIHHDELEKLKEGKNK